MSTFNIKEVAAWMVREKFFIIHKGRYVVSEKFNKEVRGVQEGLTKIAGKLKVVELERPRAGLSPEEWQDCYLKFIIDCKIPKFISSGNGSLYEANKFSQAGLKQFRKMIEEEGVDLEKLTAITTLYYADRRKMVKAIGNYITEGIWRTDYASAPEAPKPFGGTKYEY